MDKEKEEQQQPKKRSKKHTETKLAIKGSFEDVIAASFLGKPPENKPAK
ncbi:hypothetical protein [Mucilaginibacter polytrichastri]|uniref:Uncharacterized protein n=1 Tax=Mucilaginibacter polytrichastri TaxID=1302689 RepID=A0A1Q5ZU03_9SPHI|nr:hypothetical protein [Mucilaginibacter polytrichastri]OKS85236.1 hypothetical protein RG47T_0680 [Mucilaginibacter polytrichastri]SFS42260.1 hypothetical protein SAMN04487890_101411 [Mucilaginibacter polytrichastri]